MKKNVFIPSFGNRPQTLVGRDTVLDEFMEGLAHPEGHPNRATIFMGQRGTGKTALLLELAARATGAGYIATCVTAGEQLLDDILQLLQVRGEKYIKGKKRVQGVNAGAFGFSFGLSFTEEVQKNYGFRMKMTILVDELAKHGKGVLILVDEVRSNAPQLCELAVTYQHLIGEGKNIAIAMAGLPGSVSSVLHDDILTFLNRARKIYLGPLPLNDVSLFYSNAFEQEGKILEAETLNYLTKSTMGYPYLMQLIGFYVLKYVGESKTIEMQNAEAAVISAKRDLIDSIHKISLRSLSDKDRDFLKAMSVDNESSRIADIQERMGVSAAYIQQYRARLIGSGVILSEQRGSVEFAVPYLGEYLRGELE